MASCKSDRRQYKKGTFKNKLKVRKELNTEYTKNKYNKK